MNDTEYDFNRELICQVEDVLGSGRSDQSCLETLKTHFAWRAIWNHPEADLVFLFIKAYPLTFAHALPMTRQWLTEQCFQHLDHISCEVITQFFGLDQKNS